MFAYKIKHIQIIFQLETYSYYGNNFGKENLKSLTFYFQQIFET